MLNEDPQSTDSVKASTPNITNVGVCTTAGDRVPGPRALSMLLPVTWYDWRGAVDTIEEVGSKDSYELSLWLSRNGIIAGPSSGFVSLNLSILALT